MKTLKIQDLITIGIYTAIYFFMMAFAVFLLHLLVPLFSYILTPAGTALISGIVYLLLIHRVPKFGALTIMGSVIAIFFMLSGYFAISFLPAIICGFLADIIQTKSSLSNKWRTFLSYTIFHLGLTGPVLPMWFMKDAYIKALENKGKNAEYINQLLSPINTGSFILCLLATVICSYIGLKIAQKIYTKHFNNKQLGYPDENTTQSV